MSDQAPQTPPPGDRPQRAEDPVPTPAEGAPAPQEGTRPGADSSIRPEQQEPLGPAAGLVSTAGAEARQEAAEIGDGDDPEALDLLARMGVEEEGIEAGQLLGLIVAVLLAVAALAVVLIYLFIIPTREATGRAAEAAAVNYEQESLLTEAQARLAGVSPEARGEAGAAVAAGLPISEAMSRVVQEYGADASGAVLPTTRTGWNMLVTDFDAAPAVQDSPGDLLGPRYLYPNAVARPLPDATEEVGVDGDADTIEVIEGDDAETVPEPLDDLE